MFSPWIGLIIASREGARKYSLTKEGAQKTLEHLPMLAKPFYKYAKDGTRTITPPGKKFVFPAIMQRKYDGVRCMAKRVGDKIILTSRQGKQFNLPHIESWLAELPERAVLDGELYIHGMPVKDIVSAVKKFGPNTLKIRYIVYDVQFSDEPDLPQIERGEWLLSSFGGERRGSYANDQNCSTASVILAETFTVDSMDDAMKMQTIFLAEGYEGGILRAFHGQYRFAHRSSDLLKVKQFEDAEFTIAAIVDGKRRHHAIFVCYLHGHEGELPLTDVNTFRCVKKGGLEEQREDYALGERLHGELLTVRYANLTEDKKPFHPVGLQLREDWDR